MTKHLATGLLLAAAIATAGCAPTQTKPEPYPRYDGGPRVFVSGGNLSTWTETPAQDYLIPNSQVFVAARSSASSTGALVLGPVGAIIGSQMDRSRSAELLGDRGEALAIKFDGIVRDELAKRMTSGAPGSLLRFADRSEDADIQLLPFARLTEGVLPNTSGASLVLIARYRDAQSSEPRGRRYNYSLGDTRPFGGNDGWTANNGTALRTAADAGFRRLVDLYSRDLAGEFDAVIAAEKPPMVAWRPRADPSRLVRGVLLADRPDHIVVAFQFRDLILWAMPTIIDKSLIEIERP
jgi:hypothetical protein